MHVEHIAVDVGRMECLPSGAESGVSSTCLSGESIFLSSFNITKIKSQG